MTEFRPGKARLSARTGALVLGALLLALPAGRAAADHDGQPAAYGGSARVTPVEAMPPVMARAYVVGIQEELFAHGYDPGLVDGVVGRRTVRAIRAYQRDAGLPADGVASKELLDHLMFVLPKVYAGRAWGDPGAVPRYEPAPRPELYDRERPDAPTYLLPRSEGRDEYLPDQSFQDGQTVRRAPPEANPATTQGGVVSQVQSELGRLGYYTGPVDGHYGSETQRAVYRYQQDVGLPATGVIDQALIEALLPAEPNDGSVPL
ncbi:MAG: peptidoglycan-binding protein [Rhodospirillales bacterium]|nr:peptidoglycan-binding protein [Rhodospirillales bacterium]